VDVESALERNRELRKLRVPDHLAELLSASSILAAVQRSPISPEDRCLTLRWAVRTQSIIDSHGFVGFRCGGAVVLDACVLYPLGLRDTILRVAEYDVYAVGWSRRILGEVGRNLIAHRRATPQQVRRLICEMRRTFEEAEIPEAAIAALDPAMINEPADRHVVASVVAAEDVGTSVTFNVRHFPIVVCESFGIESFTRTRSCVRCTRGRPIRFTWRWTSVALSRLRMSVHDVLNRLEENDPEFVRRVRAAHRDR
jgi:hypothetical protein